MKESNFKFKGQEDLNIYVYKYEPINNEDIKGIVQISHGMSEEAGRYRVFAKELVDNGYVVYINDHRGHGKTADNIEKVGILSKQNGIEHIVEDLKELTTIIKDEHKDLPVFLFSHSMGSFAAQRYITKYSNLINGVVLSGTNGIHGIEVDLGLRVAKFMSKTKGRNEKAHLVDKLSFGNFNKKIKNSKTPFDWLSRDEEQVKLYIDNPYCGVLFSNGFFEDLFENFVYIRNKNNLETIDKNLPIFILAGDSDPVGKYGKGIVSLYNKYNSMGIEDVSYKLYEGGRHEMLNEINKEEVYSDVIKWLDSKN
ncbi:alpha/beta hydrolase [Romboutsia sp.]|uniref:alpha/beta hydrolase n=1 Tax=Romboutsia sp. TaxID=1965302 RepID=UPI003F2ED536